MFNDTFAITVRNLQTYTNKNVLQKSFLLTNLSIIHSPVLVDNMRLSLIYLHNFFFRKYNNNVTIPITTIIAIR